MSPRNVHGPVTRRATAPNLNDCVRRTASTPKADRLQQVKKVFRAFDQDGNGTIDRGELAVLLQKIGDFSEKEVDRLMLTIDRNGNGLIEYEEFVDWIGAPKAVVGVLDGDVVAFDLESVLRPLFKVYARDGADSISRSAFKECHSIVQGALHALPIDDKQPQQEQHGANGQTTSVASLVCADSERIFREMDKDGNEAISFEEFVAWQREALFHSGVSQEGAVACISKLTLMLQTIFTLPTTNGATKSGGLQFNNPQAPVVKSLLNNIGKCSLDLWRKKKGCKRRSLHPPSALKSWQQVPEGMSTTALVRKHMQQQPIQTEGVQNMSVRVHCCLPEHLSEFSGEQQYWFARIFREVSYNSGTTRRCAYYYRFKKHTWETMPDGKHFNEAFANIPPELKLYAILWTEADFGQHTLDWSHVNRCLKDAIKMGIISCEDHLEYQLSIEKCVIPADTSDNALAAQLLLELRLTPHQVLAGLCDLDILPEYPLWEGSAVLPDFN